MPEVLLRFLLDLSPKDAKLISVWLQSNPLAIEQMIRVIGKPVVAAKGNRRCSCSICAEELRDLQKAGR